MGAAIRCLLLPLPPPVAGDSPTTTMMLLMNERGGRRRRRCGGTRSGCRRCVRSSTAPTLTGRLFDVPLLQPIFVSVGKVERRFIDPEAKDAGVVRLRRFGRNHVLLKEKKERSTGACEYNTRENGIESIERPTTAIARTGGGQRFVLRTGCVMRYRCGKVVPK